MPHCIIEYSKALEDKIKPTDLINKVYQGTFKSNLFIDTDIKTRAISYKHHQTGEIKLNFVHITIKILSGRSKEQKITHVRNIYQSILQLINETNVNIDIITKNFGYSANIKLTNLMNGYPLK